MQPEDVTVSWKMWPPRKEEKFGKWRLAVFRDMRESLDGSQLYFLYDPQEDEMASRGEASLLVFDLHLRCFVSYIPLDFKGCLKFLFTLKCASSGGGTSLIIVTERVNKGDRHLQLYLVEMRADGRQATSKKLLHAFPVDTGLNYIVAMREDAPIAVILTSPVSSSPSKNVSRVWSIKTNAAGMPFQYFDVSGVNLSDFYAGFVVKNGFLLLSTTESGYFDSTRVYYISLEAGSRLQEYPCHRDALRGFPSKRKDTAITVNGKYLFLAGGMSIGARENRLTDIWYLDLDTMNWREIPLLLIKPRLSATAADFDLPLYGMPRGGTHLRIFKMHDFEVLLSPPPYHSDHTVHESVSGPDAEKPQPPYARSDAPLSAYATVHSAESMRPSIWLYPATPQPRGPRESFSPKSTNSFFSRKSRRSGFTSRAVVPVQQMSSLTSLEEHIASFPHSASPSDGGSPAETPESQESFSNSSSPDASQIKKKKKNKKHCNVQ